MAVAYGRCPSRINIFASLYLSSLCSASAVVPAPPISTPLSSCLAANAVLTLPSQWLPLLPLNQARFSVSKLLPMPPLFRPLPLPLQPFPSCLLPPSLPLPQHRMTWMHARVAGKVSRVKSTACHWHRRKRMLRRKRQQRRQRSWLTQKCRVHAGMPAAAYSTYLVIRCQP